MIERASRGAGASRVRFPCGDFLDLEFEPESFDCVISAATLHQVTQGELRIEDAALYPALHRMEARDLIESEWGTSENNRRARYYRLTRAGRKALQTEAAGWSRYARLVARVLEAVEQSAKAGS